MDERREQRRHRRPPGQIVPHVRDIAAKMAMGIAPFD